MDDRLIKSRVLKVAVEGVERVLLLLTWAYPGEGGDEFAMYTKCDWTEESERFFGGRSLRTGRDYLGMVLLLLLFLM